MRVTMRDRTELFFRPVLYGYQSTCHTVNLSHGQLITRSSHHTVNSSPVNSSHASSHSQLGTSEHRTEQSHQS